MTRQQRTYIFLIILFVLAGMYFTSYFTIAIENRSGQVIDKLELDNRFKQAVWTNIPPDSVIVIKAFIPFDRQVKVRTESGAGIRHYMFTAENAYAGTKYNTLVIEAGISRESH